MIIADMGASQKHKKLSTEELVRLYREAASVHGQANRSRDYRAGNPAADTVAAIYREIRSRGVEHQRRLLPLLLSADDGIRGWAAAHALELEPGQGEAILLDIAKLNGLQGFSARMTLKVWRGGTLRFP
jgi:Domain of unknown function (DUF2019)